MSTITKRILSLVLSFVMLIGMLPINALAEDNAEGMPAVSVVDAAADGTEGSSVGGDGTEQNPEVILDENQENPDVNPDEGQGNPDEGQGNPDEGQGNPDEGQGNPDEGQGNPDEGQGNPDEGQGNPDEGQGNPDEGQGNPDEGQGNPDEGQGNPDEGQGNPDEGQGNPDENVGDTEEDAEGTENTEDTEEEAEETEDDVEELETDESEEEALLSLVRDGTPLAVVYAASDFQPEGDQSVIPDTGDDPMIEITDAMIKAGYAKGTDYAVTGALIVGDYSNHYDTWTDINADKNSAGLAVVAGILKTKWDLTSNLNKLSNLMTDGSNAGDNVVYIQGNHDPAETKGLDKFGANDTEHYGVFAIHEDNFQWYQNGTGDGNTTDAQQAAIDTAEALKTYLQGKVDAKDNRPIFVMSHVPLHFGWRTYASNKYGDNIYAKYLFDVLNEYGKQLNIIFLFGHNHSSTYDDYLGGAAIYLPAGDSIRIPNLGSTTNSSVYKLNFTYMNAGYLGYYGGQATDSDDDQVEKLYKGMSSTIFEIYDGKVYISRFDHDSEENLKNEGLKSSSDTWDGAAANTDTYASGQVITLKTFQEELTSPVKASGVMTKGRDAAVSVSGLYGKSYNVVWSSSDDAVATVTADANNPMQATITSKTSGNVTITATITEVSNTRAVGDSKPLSMDLEVVEVEMVTLAAKDSTIYVLDDNQDSSSWTADTSKKYIIVSQDKGNPTAGEFMAMYYNEALDPAEGDDGGGERELNAEPITVMPLLIDGETVYAVATEDNSFKWSFIERKQNPYWYEIRSEKTGADSLMLSKLHSKDARSTYDPDGDGIRVCGARSGYDHGYAWCMSGQGTGLTARPYGGSEYYYSPYYDPIQGDFSVYYTGYGDDRMGKRVYLYEETTVEQDILAYMKNISGSVSQGVGPDAGTGDVIYIQNGDDIVTVPVTISMLSGTGLNTNAAGTYTGLTVTYAGKTITTDYTLTVTDAATLLKNQGGKFRSTIYRLVEEMVGGRHYLIVDNNEAGEAHAMGATGSASYSAVSAHNVLIQSFKVEGEKGLYIDSTRYSDQPDNPVNYIITDQGNVNDPIFSDNHNKSVRLVWTPTKIVDYGDGSYADDWFTTESISAPYYFLTSKFKYHEGYGYGRLWTNNFDGVNYQPVLFIGGSTSEEEEWAYVPTSNSNDKDVREDEGLVLTYKGENVKKDISYWEYSTEYTKARFRLFYNPEVNNSSSFENQNFIVEEMRTNLYSPLHRRTWIYEQDDSIDTITARLNDKTGYVTAGCNASVHTGDYILVETYGTDGSLETVEVPVRVSMLSGNLNTKTAGTYAGLTVTYEGKVIATDYTLVVSTPVPNDKPDFPQEGAVKIDKQLDTTQYNYLTTGAAVIDLSVTGIPAQSGVDVLFVLDTSSSMWDCIHNVEYGSYCDDCKATINKNTNSRLALLKKTLVNTLTQLKEPINGYTPDIEVAVACFNGYTPINGDIMLDYTKTSSGDTVSSSTQTQLSEYRIDSSNVSLNFTDVANLNAASMQAAADGLYLNAGTNYDRGLEMAYDMLKEKQERDALNGETRQQILVFMSDGTPFQFNYAHGTARMNDWNNWLLGNAVSAVPSDTGAAQLFAEYRNAQGKHWMAEAIKGDPNQKYKIINPDMQDSNTKVDYVNGLGATIYTIGMGIADDLQVTAASAETVLKNIASEDSLFFKCMDPADFEGRFSEIANTVRSAGDAVFTDQMGDDFDLITYNQKTFEGSNATVSYNPQIILRKYPLYHRSDIGNTVDGVKVTSTMVGTRRPVEPTVIETVIFGDGTTAYSTHVDKDGDEVFGAKKNDDGTYSIQDTGDNILIDGVICAKTFWYNTTQATVQIDTNGDGTAETALEKECFYWNVGDIPQDELVLTYPVYLTGSMEGTRPGGTYDTNTHAELNYVNYLDHPCTLSVPTPKLPWDQATVGYGFYLVDKDGNPIINQTNGTTGSFEQSVKVTQPVYKDFFQNSEGAVINATTTVTAGDVLPEGYVLFDTAAAYEVSMASDGTGHYAITKDAAVKETTYVQGVAANAVTGSGTVTTESYATANTIVWFAVTATVQCVPDTVVIDYGLPVEIDVMKNDVMLGDYANLEYIGATSHFTNGTTKLWQYLQNMGATQTAKFNSTEVEGTYGKAKVKNTNDLNAKVRYTLNESNGMQMKEEETFVYAVNYKGSVGTQGYYYSTVTVIPATSIYYEDSFMKYSVFQSDGTKLYDMWETDEDEAMSGNQAQDRPGEYSLPEVDANNIYGYDGAYKNMATYSMGSAQKITVTPQLFAEAQFTFNGTGFDVVSMTSNTSGAITVSVYKTSEFINADGTNNYNAMPVKTQMVDTYYGYKRALCHVTYEWDVTDNYPEGYWARIEAIEAEPGTQEKPVVYKNSPVEGDTAEGVEYVWIANTEASDTLYQVPVIKFSGLEYGEYTALITAWYEKALDHQPDNEDGTYSEYDFYLDAIRIYDPANDGADNDTIRDAYVADGEGWPEYFELRNLIISKNDFNSLEDGTGSGIVFIDNTNDTNNQVTYTISDYTNYGPNNELYLAPGQSVAFHLSVTDPALDQIHIAMKSVGNGTAYVKYYDAGATTAEKTVAKEIATATDLYYDITALNGKTVVITNSGDSSNAILSITNVKVTYKSEHVDGIESNFFTTTQQSAEVAVASLMRMVRPPVTPEEPEVPESSEPTPSEPENSEPDESIPEVEPEVFEPRRCDVRLSKNSVKVGQKVTVTVTTSKDVDYITVNGSKVTKYSGRRFGNTRTWQLQLKAEEAGELDVAVVCYNRDKLASAPVVKTVKVADKKAFEPKRFDVRLSDTSVKAGSKVTVTVTTSKDVECITVNGSKVTRYSGSRFSNTRTWQVRVNARDVGEMDVTVVCYNRDKVASAPVVKTVTVTKKYTNIHNPMKDFFAGYFDKFWGRR